MLPTTSQSLPEPPAVLGIYDALVVIWSRKWLLASFVLLGIALAALRAFTMTPSYQATTVLAIASDTGSQSKLGALIGQFGGLAGGMFPLGEGGNSAEYVALLTAPQFVGAFIERNKLLPVLYEKRWDSQRNKWKSDDADDVPTMDDAYRYFLEEVMTVEQKRDTGLIDLAVRWRDPEAAAAWANGLVAMANEQIRARAIAEAQASFDYLRGELGEGSVVEVQQAIYRLMEAQLNVITLANVRHDYAFRVISAAPVADRDNYVSPKKLQMIVIGLIAGAMLGSIVILFAHAARGRGVGS